MEERPSGLDDPGYAAFAWRRYRRILAGMAIVAIGAAAIAVWGLQRSIGAPLPLHMVAATILGVALTIMMAAALMGLIFLSSGTGHDEDVERADLGEDAAIWKAEDGRQDQSN